MLPNYENIESAFEQMKSNGWDTDSPMQWGFYFTDSTKDKLLSLFAELEEKNYLFEELEFRDDNQWMLHVSKIDTLTPEKLHKRNIAFNELADYCEVDLYDGWDVAPIK